MRTMLTAVSAAGLLGAALVPAAAAAGQGETADTAANRTGVSATADAAEAFTPAPIRWGACDDSRLVAAGAQCGMLTVPLDYNNPSGTKIKIAVSRVKHTSSAKNYQGIALVNPGGPGGSGYSLSRLGQWIPKDAGDRYDWIGFDPRGVGRSVPALECDNTHFGYDRPNYIPSTYKLEQTWLQKSAAYAAKCDAAGGELLDHVKTIDTVRDMESIRKALGQKKINYYGFSYGTYLGQVYSTKFPARVGRMVWDGVVDPRGVWYRANLAQDVAFDKNINIYFKWIARHDDVYHLGTNGDVIRMKWYQMRDKLDASPALGKIGPDEWTDAFLSAGYYVYGWEDIAKAYSAAINDGNWQPMLEAYNGANGEPGVDSDNNYAMYLATQCTDVQWPTSWDKWRTDNWRTHSIAPFETWANAWYNAPCLTWGAKAPQYPAVSVSGEYVPPVLLIGETHDAATPFSGALEVRKRYPRSVLIEGVNGTTHSGSLSGVACTDNRVADYLLTGKLPARDGGSGADVKCPPVPKPDPQPAGTTGLQSADGSSAVAAGRAELTKALLEAQSTR